MHLKQNKKQLNLVFSISVASSSVQHSWAGTSLCRKKTKFPIEIVKLLNFGSLVIAFEEIDKKLAIL